ncbi:hypothetical protein JW710_02290 [Candidatus Dojkabacteria bacterium]|nr:hypothetical protein [Candidatus Dojkabacteria bacterium]
MNAISQGLKSKLIMGYRILIILAIPLLFGAYLWFRNTLPLGYSKRYEIQIGTNDDNQSKACYFRNQVADGRMSETFTMNNDFYRKLYSGPIYVVCNPSLQTEDIDSIEFTATFKSDQSIQIGMTDYDSYYYQSLYLTNIFGWNHVRLPDNTDIYSQNKIGRKDEITLEEWLKNNVKDSNPRVGITKDIKIAPEIIYDETEIESLAKPGKTTSISTPIRGGNYTIYTVLQDEIAINVTKRDFNRSKGSDQIELILFDHEGNEIDNQTIADDGTTGTRDTNSESTQSAQINKKSIKTGLYTLEVNSGSDLQIEDITINSEKVVFKGFIYPLSQVTIFTKTDISSRIEFYSHRNDTSQKATVNDGREFIVGQQGTKEINLTEESNTIAIEEGGIQILGTTYFSFTEDQYFLPSQYYLTKSISDENDLNILKNYSNPQSRAHDFVEVTQIISKEDFIFAEDNIVIFAINFEPDGSPIILGDIAVKFEKFRDN